MDGRRVWHRRRRRSRQLRLGLLHYNPTNAAHHNPGLVQRLPQCNILPKGFLKKGVCGAHVGLLSSTHIVTGHPHIVLAKPVSIVVAACANSKSLLLYRRIHVALDLSLNKRPIVNAHLINYAIVIRPVNRVAADLHRITRYSHRCCR